MATEQAEVQETQDAAGADPQAAGQTPPGRFNLKGKKVKILLMLAGMMAVYAVAGYLFVPKPATESHDDEHVEGGHGTKSGHGVDKVEIELGDGSFATTNEQAVVGASIQVRCKLCVTVAQAQAEEFRHLANEIHKNRVNQAVIEIFRAASHDDLRDPELNVIKQKIREKVNRLLGTTAIIDVVFSGYSKMEQ